MARCCEVLENSCDIDFVDINMGCPIDLVCNKGAGSAMLLRPGRMRQCVEASSRVLSCPLTFKIRTGYHDKVGFRV